MVKLPDKLRERDEKAIFHFLRNGNKSEAYREYIADESVKANENAIWANACRYFSRDNVKIRLEQLKREIPTFYTAEDYFNEINEARDLAKEVEQPNVMLNCAKAKAEQVGMMKKEIDISVDAEKKKLTDEDRDILARLNINISCNLTSTENE